MSKNIQIIYALFVGQLRFGKSCYWTVSKFDYPWILGGSKETSHSANLLILKVPLAHAMVLATLKKSCIDTGWHKMLYQFWFQGTILRTTLTFKLNIQEHQRCSESIEPYSWNSWIKGRLPVPNVARQWTFGVRGLTPPLPPLFLGVTDVLRHFWCW